MVVRRQDLDVRRRRQGRLLRRLLAQPWTTSADASCVRQLSGERVPVPEGLVTLNRPPSASTRSASLKPRAGRGVCAANPSSITSTLSNHSAIDPHARLRCARAWRRRQRLGAQKKAAASVSGVEAPVGKRPREGGTGPLGELTQPLREPALGEKCRMNASRQLTELSARPRPGTRARDRSEPRAQATRSSGRPRRPEDPPRGAGAVHPPPPRSGAATPLPRRHAGAPPPAGARSRLLAASPLLRPTSRCIVEQCRVMNQDGDFPAAVMNGRRRALSIRRRARSAFPASSTYRSALEAGSRRAASDRRALR